MRFFTVALTSAAANLVAAAPFSFPLANGFPNLNSTALALVNQLAGGTQPTGPSSTMIPTFSDAGIQALRLIAANELAEVAFFSELVSNITNNVPNYQCEEHVLASLISVLNQEQLHAIAAGQVLADGNITTIQPCQYSFPVDNFDDAIALAQTFTDLVLGVLPQAQQQFARDAGAETGLIPLVGSIIGQEGEQNGLFRTLQKKVASAAPFLTGASPKFAYTALMNFIVPGSCPNIDLIGLKAFPALTVEILPKAENMALLLSANGTFNTKNASVAYITGQDQPVTVPISDVYTHVGKTYFFAPFPYIGAGFARGLTIAALVSGNETFTSAAAVADATLYGPALIEVN